MTLAYGLMHEGLSADNIPIGSIKVYLGPDSMF